MKESFWQRLLRGVCHVQQRPDWVRFAGTAWPAEIMNVAVTDDYHAKQGRSTGRWVLEQGDERLSVYLKRHHQLPWWRGLLALLWPGRGWSPGWQEAKHLEWARAEGFPVPGVVAVAEYIGPWGRLQSMLAIEELQGMLPLHQAVPYAFRTLPRPIFDQWKRELVAELARLARELHRRCCYHKDFYLCHFFLPRADIDKWSAAGRDRPGMRGRLHLIDFQRLTHHRWTWPLWQVKDLAQLLYSSEVEGITPRDRVRFWYLYRGTGPRTLAVRFCEWILCLKSRRYRNHNHKLEQKKACQKAAGAGEAAA